jgi:hypothetical protein
LKPHQPGYERQVIGDPMICLGRPSVEHLAWFEAIHGGSRLNLPAPSKALPAVENTVALTQAADKKNCWLTA